MSTALTILFSVLLVLVFTAGSTIFRHLIAGRVPHALEPLAVRWISTGRDPKWVRASLWVMFWLFACVVFGVIAFCLYEGAVGLGVRFK